MSIRYVAVGLTEIGKVREENQDAFYSVCVPYMVRKFVVSLMTPETNYTAEMIIYLTMFIIPFSIFCSFFSLLIEKYISPLIEKRVR